MQVLNKSEALALGDKLGCTYLSEAEEANELADLLVALIGKNLGGSFTWSEIAANDNISSEIRSVIIEIAQLFGNSGIDGLLLDKLYMLSSYLIEKRTVL